MKKIGEYAGNQLFLVGDTIQLSDVEKRRLLYEPIESIKPIIKMHDKMILDALNSKKRL